MDEHDNLFQRPASFEDGQDVRDRSFEFACRVVKFCEDLDAGRGVGRLMVPQLLNCDRDDDHQEQTQNMAAKKAKAREEKAARLSRKAPKRGYEFQIPNS